MDVGARLRDAREARGLSLDAVSRSTRVQPRILSAIETNDSNSLPPRPYGRGFVHAYASEVGLDPDGTVREFFCQFAPPIDTVVPETLTTFDGPRREPSTRPWLWSIGGIFAYATVGALVIFAGRWALDGGGKSAAAPQRAGVRAGVPAPPQRARAPVGNPAPPQRASVPVGKPAPLQRTNVPGNPAPLRRASVPAGIPAPLQRASVPAGTPASLQRASVPAEDPAAPQRASVPIEDPAPLQRAGARAGDPAVGTIGGNVPAVTAAADQPSPAQSTPADGVAIELEARGPAWVDATVDGQRAIYRMLQPGERVSLKGAREVSIRTGDAGALMWQVNGRPAAIMGRAGKVRTQRVTPENVNQVK